MDFEPSEDVRELAGLAASIFRDTADVDRIKHVENERGGYDAKLWAALADSGVFGAVLPESEGGAGLGMLGVIAILEAQGRYVAPIPLWPVLAGAALSIANFGSADQKARWLDGLIAGSTIVTCAPDTPLVADRQLRATRHGDTLTLDGNLTLVRGAPVADAIVLPFRLDDGTHAVAIVPTDRDNVTVTPVASTSRVSAGSVTFAHVEITESDLLPGDPTETGRHILRRCRTAVAGLQTGVCAAALAMTATYTSQRVQFGRPLSTNQAVAVRAADAHLDTEAIRLSTQRAAWLLDRGDESAAQSASLVAKWWAAAGGLRTVHATQHLHGGIGADVDYPIHRYFLWGRDAASALGGASSVAAELGAELPVAPPIGGATAMTGGK